MEFKESSGKGELENLKYDMEEQLASLVRLSINNNPAEGPLARFYVIDIISQYCENFQERLEKEKSLLNLTTEEISSLITEISLSKRSQVDQYYSGIKEGKDVEYNSNTNDTSNENLIDENNLFTTYEQENEFLKDHYKEHFEESEVSEKEIFVPIRREDDPHTSLTNCEEDICINEYLYKFCYSPQTYNLYLFDKKNMQLSGREISSDVNWPLEEDSITYKSFTDYLRKNSIFIEEENLFSSLNFFYKDIYFEFSTRYHYYDWGGMLEKFVVESIAIDSLKHLSFPIVKSFIVYTYNSIPHSLFIILYEPILFKFTLNKIYESNVSKIIQVGDSMEELLEAIEDLCGEIPNDAMFLE